MQLDTLKRLLQSDPANRRLRTDCIAAALQTADFQSAAELAGEYLQNAPDDVELSFLKSNALIGLKDYHGAIEVLTRIQALDPLNNAIAQNLSLCHYVIGNFTAAREQAELVYAAGERSAATVRILVSSCHHLGLMERALQVADENKEIARNDGALAGVFALLYSDDSRIIDAKKFATYSLRANPNNLDALTTDASLRMAGGDIDAASIEFDKIISLNPSLGRAHLGLGSIALLHQDFDKAKTDLRRALELMPEHVGTWHVLGWAHLVSNELDEAEKIFNHALELDRNFAETHGALAAIAAIRGDKEKAENILKVALRLDPESLAPLFAQSVLAARSGDMRGSQEMILNGMKQLMSQGSEEGFAKLLMTAARHKRKG